MILAGEMSSERFGHQTLISLKKDTRLSVVFKFLKM